MNDRIFSIAAKVATPISLASLSVVTLYLVYQGLLGLRIFGDLTGDQTAHVINTLADKVFYLAIFLSAVSVPAYLYAKRLEAVGQRPKPQTVTGNVLFEDGRPVAQAIVFVEGVDRRKETDLSGWFQIQVEDRPFFIVRATYEDYVAEISVKRAKLTEPVRLVLQAVNQRPSKTSPKETLTKEVLSTETVSSPGSLDVLLERNSELLIERYPEPKFGAKRTLYCSFCGKSQHEVRKLIAGPTVFICDECSDLCSDIVFEELKTEQAPQINELCETTLQLANHALPLEDRTKLQDRADVLASGLRSRRRERPGDLVAGAMLTRVVGNGNFGAVWEAQVQSSDNGAIAKSW